MARHRSTPPDPSQKETILQALISIIGIVIVLAAVQLTWMFGGNTLDAIHTQERIAQTSPNTIHTSIEETEKIAEPRRSPPPIPEAPTNEGFIGWMHIPRLGDGWKRAIQQGTGLDVLDNLGIGHYVSTPMPGAEGNTAYAGHRTPGDLGYAERIEKGDHIYIQTNEAWYVYTVERHWITTPDDTQPIKDTPGSHVLTLTTCDPMVNARTAPRRLIIRAHYAYWAATADGVPEELAKTRQRSIMRQVGYKASELVRTVARHAPITPLIGSCALAAWLLFDLVAGACTRFRHRPWNRSGNLFVWLWRIQFGPIGVRVVSYLLMWLGLVFMAYAWVCPWAATWVGASDTVF